jgi:hypothetical protein
MRAKPLSTNSIKHKMFIQHDSQFTIRGVKNLHVRDFSRTIFNSTHDNSHYMGEDVESVYIQDHAMLKVSLLLRHIYQEHLYGTVCHHSRILHELRSLHIGTGRSESLTSSI